MVCRPRQSERLRARRSDCRRISWIPHHGTAPRSPSTDTDTSTDTSPRTDPDTDTSTNTGSLALRPADAVSVGRLCVPGLLDHLPGVDVMVAAHETDGPPQARAWLDGGGGGGGGDGSVTSGAPRADAADGPARPPANARYRDAKAPLADRVADLLARMTPRRRWRS